MDPWGMLIDLGWTALLYMVPTAIAWRRHHHQRYAIAAGNFFLGWTILGWIVALCWALTQVRPAPVVPTDPCAKERP
jgi:Superinfection immunity protein